MTIIVTYNGGKINCPNEITLDILILQQANTESCAAVAINGNFVPKNNYPTTRIQQGDVIDVVSPVTGG